MGASTWVERFWSKATVPVASTVRWKGKTATCSVRMWRRCSGVRRTSPAGGPAGADAPGTSV